MSEAAFVKIKEGLDEALTVSREFHLEAEEIVNYLPIDGSTRAILRNLIVQALWKERSRHRPTG